MAWPRRQVSARADYVVGRAVAALGDLWIEQAVAVTDLAGDGDAKSVLGYFDGRSHPEAWRTRPSGRPSRVAYKPIPSDCTLG